MADPDFVISAGLVFDGRRDVRPRKEMMIAVRSGKVLDVVPRTAGAEKWPLYLIHDLSDCTVLPGLIDTHVHLSLPGNGTSFERAMEAPRNSWKPRVLSNAQAHLCRGVTTLRDLGSPFEAVRWIRSKIEERPLDYPRVLLFGPPLTEPAGHMYLFSGECKGARQVAAMALRNLRGGSDGIKIVASGGGTKGSVPHQPSFSCTELTAAVRVCHEFEKKATAHALATRAIDLSIDAGCDGIEHLSFLDERGVSKFDPRVAIKLAERGVAVGSTIGCNYTYIRLAETGRVSRDELGEQRQRTASHVANAGKLREIGAQIVAGSDAGWKFTRFGDFIVELELLARAGFSLSEVIHAATAGAASALGVDDIGRVAPGYCADLIAVEGDVTQNLRALRRVRQVYRAGRRVTLDPATGGNSVSA
jgi:imidazolonepropionase-like amidohydrolase